MTDLSDADKLVMYEAISDYSLDLKEPNLSGFPKALFSLVRPILDANTRRWRNGKKGGAPVGNSNNKGKKVNPKLTESQPKVNLNTTESQPNKDKDKDIEENNGEFINSPTQLFDDVWLMYEKKGNKKTSLGRWEKLSKSKQELAVKNIPKYVASTPDKKYRKNFEAYIHQEVWNDEISEAKIIKSKTAENETRYSKFEFSE